MIEINMKDEIETKLKIAESGKTMREFAEYIGISHTYLSQVLNGKKRPSPKIALKIADGLNSGIKDIFLLKVVD